MKLSTVSVVLAAVAVSAQTLPACGTQCAISNISNTSCQVTDQACLCKDTAYQALFQQCVASSCSAADAATTVEFGLSLCASAGVTIAVPSSSSVAAASSSSASASTSSSSVSSSSSMSASASTTASMTYAGNATMTATGSPIAFTGAANAVKIAEWAVGAVAVVGAFAL